MKKTLIALLLLSTLLSPLFAKAQKRKPVTHPLGLTAYSKQLRVDLYWKQSRDAFKSVNYIYEIERAISKEGPFRKIHEGYHKHPAYSDFIGQESPTYYYRIRTILVDHLGKMNVLKKSRWSKVVSGKALEANPDQLIDDVQEASFRYFYNYAHPVSGLPREGAHGWWPTVCSTASTGMTFFNIAVGIERGFITREEGVAHILKISSFGFRMT